jgi:hypothetical protein
MSVLHVKFTEIHKAILLLRTYALWSNNKNIGTGLLSVFSLSVIIEAFYLSKFLGGVSCKFSLSLKKCKEMVNKLSVNQDPSPSSFPGCFVSQANSENASVPYLTLLIFELCVYSPTQISTGLRIVVTSCFHSDFDKITS